ncbi:MAG: DUF2877 domain-containing protein [Rhodospirillales bacterium]|nr:DUF2877 domain-containing protein [Rhodospirillales bacterium]
MDTSARGRVMALFESSFYVETQAGLACIGNEDLEPSSLNLVTLAPAGTNWSASGLRLDDRVSVGRDCVGVGNRFSFPFSDAVAWSPDPVSPSWRIRDLRRGIKAFREAARDLVPKEGLGPFLNPEFRPGRSQFVCRIANAPIAELRRRLVTVFGDPGQRIMKEWRGVDSLAGLGPGLTPSGDDLIGGMMIALHGLGESDVCGQLWGTVRRCADTMTNAISRAHLEAAAQGQGSATIHRALSAILAGQPEAVRDTLPAIDRIGHTSGWDAMAGVIVTLESWLEARTAASLP